MNNGFIKAYMPNGELEVWLPIPLNIEGVGDKIAEYIELGWIIGEAPEPQIAEFRHVITHFTICVWTPDDGKKRSKLVLRPLNLDGTDYNKYIDQLYINNKYDVEVLREFEAAMGATAREYEQQWRNKSSSPDMDDDYGWIKCPYPVLMVKRQLADKEGKPVFGKTKEGKPKYNKNGDRVKIWTYRFERHDGDVGISDDSIDDEVPF